MSTNKRERVYICSPLKGDGSKAVMERNIELARGYARTAYQEGYSPLVPHIYYPTFLNESAQDERDFGLAEGLEWLRQCSEIWVCADDSGSEGMKHEMALAYELNIPMVYRFDHPQADF